MLSTVFLVNREGTVLIEKEYRERIDRADIEAACNAIRDQTQNPPGIIPNGDYTIILSQVNDIWLVGVTEGDEFALFSVSVVEYAGRLLDELLPKGATEVSVKEQYPTVYQILDYAIDFGYPFLDESNTIKTLLTRPPTDLSKGIGRLQLDFQRPWRSVGMKHIANELLVDVIETMDVTVNCHGRVEFCHIRGEVKVQSKLSGTPRVTVSLGSQCHYEDCVFHRCAEIQSIEQRVVPFVPPDGRFVLMKYRITTTRTDLPVFIAPKFNWSSTGCTFEIVMKPQASLPKRLEALTVTCELPEGLSIPSITPQKGKVMYDQTTREIIWKLGIYTPKEPATLKGSVSCDSGFELAGRNPTISVEFKTVGITPSGFKVDKVDIDQVSYKAFKGIKYTTQTGEYEFRTGMY